MSVTWSMATKVYLELSCREWVGFSWGAHPLCPAKPRANQISNTCSKALHVIKGESKATKLIIYQNMCKC